MDNRDLNYDKFFEKGNVNYDPLEDYNSHNTQRLDLDGMKTLLMKLRFLRLILDGKEAPSEE